MGTIKSGWLLKLSGFFKNSWKKRYFTLYKDGEFCYYQGPGDKEADGKIHMKIECRRIDKGHAVGEGVKAPSNISINAIFSVASPERTWFLCAETEAECSEWISALEEARKPLGFQAGAGSAMPPYQQPAPGAPPPYPGPPMTGAAGVPPYPTQPPLQGAPSPYPPQPAMPYPGQAAPGPYPQQPPMPYPPQPSSYPSQPYPQQPPQQYPPQPAGYAPPAPGYAPPPGQYPRQQYYAPGTNVVQGVRPQQPQTVYVQDSSGKNSSKKNMLMGAAGGAVGGMALGYMMGSAMGGGHHYHGWGGGWDSDHSWSSGGSFDCDFD